MVKGVETPPRKSIVGVSLKPPKKSGGVMDVQTHHKRNEKSGITNAENVENE